MGNRSALSGTRITVSLAILAVIGLSACEKDVTAPVDSHATVTAPQTAFTITPGLTAYTDRAAWAAAVTAAGSSAQLFSFAGQTLGRITALDTDYGTFHLTVDRVSSISSFNNPGLAVLPDASCSIGTGDCNEFIFNMQDPTSLLGDAPTVNTLVMPSNIIAFGGNFGQVGIAVGGGDPTLTGPVTLHFGTESVVVNDYVPTGYGFFGVVSTVPSTNVSLTFTKSGSLINDVVELYVPAFANAPVTIGPGTVAEQLTALHAFLGGIGFLAGKPNPYDSKLNDVELALAQNSRATACASLSDFMKKVGKKTNRDISATDAATLLDMAITLAETIGC